MLQIRPLALNQQKPKSLVTKPDFSTLTQQQCDVVRVLRNFLESTSSYLLIEGQAGVGKTYTLALCIQDILYRYPKVYVGMAAPVNRAVDVINAQTSIIDDRLIIGTIHNLAGLRLKENPETFEVDFVKDYENPSILDELNILIVDEASMVNEKLIDLLDVHYVKRRKLKIIFVGDGEQIPPIGEYKALPFLEDARVQMGIHYVALNEVVRQAKGNPIIELVTHYRLNIHSKNPLPKNLKTNLSADGKGVLCVEQSDVTMLRTLLKNLFTSQYFKDDANYAKVVAYTNEEAESFNRVIRRLIYGKEVKKIEIGEKLVATGIIKHFVEDRIIIHNSQNMVVISCELKEDVFLASLKLKYYLVEVQLQDKSKHTIRIIAEESEADLDKQLTKMYKTAMKEKDKVIKEEIFKQFKHLSSRFADVSYNYALTAHKAQGSTFQYCMVLAYNIFGKRIVSPKASEVIYERNRIANTAFTRASETLIIVQ